MIIFYKMNVNPLVCDDRVLWIREAEGVWLTVTSPETVICGGPDALTGRAWNSLNDAELNGLYHMLTVEHLYKLYNAVTIMLSDALIYYIPHTQLGWYVINMQL